MLRAGQVQTRKDPPLSPADLKILEESAARLMADLRAVTDECVARIECACADAERRMCSIEPKSILVSDVSVEQDDHPSETNLTNGEIELLKGLKAIGME